MKKQNTPAISPIAIADIGDTNPDAGVIATSPATAPEIAPSTDGLPLRIHSAALQPIAAAAAPKCVATNADVASVPAASADPGVEPEPPHPQQARPDKAQHHGVRLHRFFADTQSACPDKAP